jgi:integrase
VSVGADAAVFRRRNEAHSRRVRSVSRERGSHESVRVDDEAFGAANWRHDRAETRAREREQIVPLHAEDRHAGKCAASAGGRRGARQVDGDSEHFFTSGKTKPQTARANWSRYLDTVFELAKVKDAHSHRFRDTFAVSLLENGVSIENVSVLLGHSSVRITERHYKPWVKTLQRKLEEEVRKTWG